jgi:hypothetical protein
VRVSLAALLLLIILVLAQPRSLTAQQPGKIYRVGVLALTLTQGPDWGFLNELKKELKG